jgi:M6 family metalloprotease-like protein
MNTSKQAKFCALVVTVSVMFSLFAAPASWAIPASPFPFTVTQPDGTIIELYKRGDEFNNWVEGAEGYTVVKNEATGYWEFAESRDGKLVSTGVAYGPGKTPPAGLEKHQKPEVNAAFRKAVSASTGNVWTPRSTPLAGDYKILLIRVQFQDREFETTEELHKEQAFGASGSLRDYYLDQSLGKLNIVSAIDGLKVITVKLTRDHPDRSISNEIDEMESQKNEVAFVTEVLVEAQDAFGFKLSDFDVNDDGYVSPDELCVYMILAGYEEANTDKPPAVWAHAGSSFEEYGPEFVVEVDGVILTDWAMQGELIGDGIPQQMGTMAHELGHQLCRLPDLYDISESNSGLGNFSLMDRGCNGTEINGIPGSTPVNLDAWSRRYLGWEKPRQPANGPVTFTTPELGNGESSVKLLMDRHRNTEFFLVEVRDFSGWDAGLEGLFLKNLKSLSKKEAKELEESLEFLTDFKGGLLIMHVDETVGAGSLDKDNDINDAKKNIHQGVMAVDAGDPRRRAGKASTHLTLWWGDNRLLAGLKDSSTGTVEFKTPESNFYGNIATDISITGIGGVENGTLTATVSAPRSGRSGGGCNSGFAMAALAAVFLVVKRRSFIAERNFFGVSDSGRFMRNGIGDSGFVVRNQDGSAGRHGDRDLQAR